jgi:biopolymer transport protein ExbD
LVLLIIFIITVPVLTHSVNVDLPRADNTPTELKPETINLAVDATGLLFWNDTQISDAELELRLETEASKQPQPEVHIRGDKAVAYEHVVKAMSAVQRAGILKLGFVTDPGN